jgi:hypothetical protein
LPQPRLGLFPVKIAAFPKGTKLEWLMDYGVKKKKKKKRGNVVILIYKSVDE